MLVILCMFPVAAPTKSFGKEQAVTQISPLYLIRKSLVPVRIRTTGSRLYFDFSAFQYAPAGIIERINVNGHSKTVL